jgi:hypothetical protein
MPVIGYQEQVGETKENHTEPRQQSRDYWKGVTRASYGATAWFPARIVVTGPEAYTLNSVGVCTSNTVEGGKRTQVWETDIGQIEYRGRPGTQRGYTAVFYHPRTTTTSK